MTVHMIMYSWLSYKSDMTSRTQWKITGPLLNSSICHFTTTWWNMTDFFIYWDFCIFATTGINQTSLTTMTDLGK
jgi:hypothetical protein